MEFVYVTWEDGDWGTLFRSSFGLVIDGSPGNIELSPEEQVAFDALTSNNEQTHSWDLFKETIGGVWTLTCIKERYYHILFIYSIYFYMTLFCI